jgi:hypothetical protein
MTDIKDFSLGALLADWHENERDIKMCENAIANNWQRVDNPHAILSDCFRMKDSIESKIRDAGALVPLSEAKQIEILTAKVKELEAGNRWIPVEERLPETRIRVDILRTCPDGFDYQNGCYMAKWDYWWSDILACKLKFVTHWRPLPAAPEVKQ